MTATATTTTKTTNVQLIQISEHYFTSGCSRQQDDSNRNSDNFLLAVKLAVSLPQPGKRRSTPPVQTVMKVHECVVVLHVLVKCVPQVTETHSY